MFLDVAEIAVRSGRGGNGSVAFRREARVPRGGPAGGDGGRGGNVLLTVEPARRTLLDFKYKSVFAAQNGRHGGGARKTGKSGNHLTIPVPPGTLVHDVRSGEVLADLVHPGDTLLAARGGAGGRGNAAFATPTRQSPRFAEMGEKSDERRLRLELKLIADAGIVGYPNVGKSTLISTISAARPTIAPYHFTTLEPNLGVVQVDAEHSFVVADVPGLIEGAHRGVGLGHEFLRHVERTRMLVHVVDIAGTEGRDPVQDYLTINRELELHDARLAALPQIVAMNKTDVLQEEGNLERLGQAAAADGREGLAISAVTGRGLTELVGRIGTMLQELTPARDPDAEPQAARRFEAPLPPHHALEVRRLAPNVFLVRGAEAERLVERANIESAPGVEWLHEELDRAGVIERLDAAGAAPGDTVFIGEVELEYAWG